MKKITIAIMLICLASLTSCVIVRIKAPTILTLRSQTDGSQSLSLGFSDTNWAIVNGEPTIIGCGWHPREHETYAFFINEPSFVRRPSWILLTPSKASQTYDVNLWLCIDPVSGNPSHGIEFKGKANFAKVRKGSKFRLKLDNLFLKSTDSQIQIFVSGKINAKPKTSKRVSEQLESRIKDMQKYRIQVWPKPKRSKRVRERREQLESLIKDMQKYRIQENRNN